MPLRAPLKFSALMRDGFAYLSAYNLGLGQPSPRTDYLPASHLLIR